MGGKAQNVSGNPPQEGITLPQKCIKGYKCADPDQWTVARVRIMKPLQGDVLMLRTAAKFHIGQVLRHRKHPFRGVVFDVDATFSNTDEWYENIPEEMRPSKDQPFYHLLAENEQTYYVAYVSEQNLVPDETGEPVGHPDVDDLFGDFTDGRYQPQFQMN